VVGSGPGGMAAALELAGRGRAVMVVDDDLAWGGTARALLAAGRSEWGALLGDFAGAVSGNALQFWPRTTAAGLYGDDLLLVREGADAAVQIVSARTIVLAPGAHDGAATFEGNDLPGVMSARAACRLRVHGVTPGKRPVVARLDGGTVFGEAAATLPGAAVLEGLPAKARGSARVRGVSAAKAMGASDGRERDLPCDTLLVDAPPAPAYELCAQAGATLSHERRGYLVHTGSGGRIREGVFATGEAVGVPLDPAAMTEAARRLAV
jgi:NADPH-dependent 2,4-dienoyl-CoA reductase/sulfur reductase-like enzyme